MNNPKFVVHHLTKVKIWALGHQESMQVKHIFITCFEVMTNLEKCNNVFCENLKVGGKPVERVRVSQNVYVVQPSKKSPVYWLNKYFNWCLKRDFKNPEYFYMSANNMARMVV